MGFKNTLVRAFLKRNLSRIERYRDHPFDCQDQWFEKLISQGKKTAYGKQHNFKSIKSYADFQRVCPVVDYESLFDWVDRTMNGEQALLWPDTIKWFSKSSGTTSAKSKFIPVSKAALKSCHLLGGRDMMTMYYQHNPGSKLFDGKTLVMGGSTEVNTNSKGSFHGDVSAVMLSNTPSFVDFLRAPSKEVALLGNWDEKIERMASECIPQNITGIAGVPTWTIVLIRYLYEKCGTEDLRDIWPNFELYTHGGVSFTPYREQFKRLIPHTDVFYQEAYNASEGFFAFQDDLNESGMLLMTDNAVFYEFIPMSEFGSKSPTVLSLRDVELGVNYALIVSTNAGLWRYAIGDTIEFVSKSPYRIKITGRTKHYINAFGEEVMVHNTDKAIDMACEKNQCTVNDYTVAPIFLQGAEKGGHEWIIEFDDRPQDLDQFVKDLDLGLQSLNSDYEAKRFQAMALEMPKVHAESVGFFSEWLRFKGKIGGQNKVPRLSNDRKIMEEILEFKSGL